MPLWKAVATGIIVFFVLSELALLGLGFSPASNYRCEFNSRGFRGPEPKDHGRTRIVVFGSSFTCGCLFALLLVGVYSPEGEKTFIYFQF